MSQIQALHKMMPAEEVAQGPTDDMMALDNLLNWHHQFGGLFYFP
ncbi:hypothetical protein [Levilactobacillus namurensis]|nr:hypothetical protein [Levilactobacillus namurensis]